MEQVAYTDKFKFESTPIVEEKDSFKLLLRVQMTFEQGSIDSDQIAVDYRVSSDVSLVTG